MNNSNVCFIITGTFTKFMFFLLTWTLGFLERHTDSEFTVVFEGSEPADLRGIVHGRGALTWPRYSYSTEDVSENR